MVYRPLQLQGFLERQHRRQQNMVAAYSATIVIVYVKRNGSAHRRKHASIEELQGGVTYGAPGLYGGGLSELEALRAPERPPEDPPDEDRPPPPPPPRPVEQHAQAGRRSVSMYDMCTGHSML